MSNRAPPNTRDYSREDYAPKDPNQVVYNWKSGTFSYKPRSQIRSTYSEAVPKATREMHLTPPWELEKNPSFAKKVVLPSRVVAGRLLETYKRLYIENNAS